MISGLLSETSGLLEMLWPCYHYYLTLFVSALEAKAPHIVVATFLFPYCQWAWSMKISLVFGAMSSKQTFFPLCKFNTQVRILMYRVRPPSQRLILRLQIRSYRKNVCFWIWRFLQNTYSSTHTQELLMHRAQY